jgi:hypothetical protein
MQPFRFSFRLLILQGPSVMERRTGSYVLLRRQRRTLREGKVSS